MNKEFLVCCLPENSNVLLTDKKPEISRAPELEDVECGKNKKKLKPKSDTSHRDIEKRRRDRINRSLWLLKDLVPTAKVKYGARTGRLEKAELLEMAVDHLKQIADSSVIDNGKESFVIEKKQNEENSNSLYANGFRDGAMKVLFDLCRRNVISESDIHSLSLAFLKPGSPEVTTSMPTVICGKNLPQDVRPTPKDNSTSVILKRQIDDVDNTIPCKRAHLINTDSSDSDGADSEDNSIHSSSSELASDKRRKVKHVDADSSRISPSPQTESQQEDAAHPQFTPNPHLNPVLLPAYALHASGTHYVPVILPPWGVFPMQPGSAATMPTGTAGPNFVPNATGNHTHEFKLAGPNPFFAPGAFGPPHSG